jgi:N-acetylglucosamine kinase
MKKSDFYVGIDVGGTKAELAVCSAALEVVYRKRIPTPTRDFDQLVGALVSLVHEADARYGLAPVGLGIPGIVDPHTGRHLSVNVPALNKRVLMDALQPLLKRPIALGNDCQCFALSEAHGGAADGQPSMFGAILGTGAGGGFCVDGRLVKGFNGLAGEWGHWKVPASLLEEHGLPVQPCTCSGENCLERYISGKGVALLHRMVTGGISGEEPDAADLSNRMLLGDPIAKQVFAIHLDLVAYGMASIILGMDPHAIVLGGGLSKLSHLYTDLPQAIANHVFPSTRIPPILPPMFGDAGGARGAALLARQLVSY